MQMTYELDLRNFCAWSGGRITLNRIIEEGKCNTLEFMLEELYPNGMSDTQLNDLLWFERDLVYEWLGISDEDEEEDEDDWDEEEEEGLWSWYDRV